MHDIEQRSGGSLRVRVLGGFEIEGMNLSELGGRQARTLAKQLVLARGRPVSVDAVCEALWGDYLPARAADQVSVLASRLRRALGTDRLVRRDAGYCLDIDWLDADELTALVDEARTQLVAGAPLRARLAAAAALRLARGPLLPEEPDAAWAVSDRVTTERVVTEARLLAGEAAVAGGDPEAAVAVAQSALDDDPYDERALRLLMRALASGGRPASALAAYAKARQRLAEDLGVSPSADTEAVHGAILREEPVGPPPAGGTHRSGRQTCRLREPVSRCRPAISPARFRQTPRLTLLP